MNERVRRILGHINWHFSGEHERKGPLEPDLAREELRVLIQFLSMIGASMNSAGDATTFVRRNLYRIAHAYGLQDIVIFVAPTLLLLRYGQEDAMFDLTGRIATDLRLDQVTALYRLVDEAERAAIQPAEGLMRLNAILTKPEPLPLWLRVAGCSFTVAGISLLLESSAEEILLCAALGVLIGLIEVVAGQWRALWPLVPATAGLLIGAVVFELIDQGLNSNGARVFIPPLAIFLPGAAMTVSMIELANGDILAGASRLAAGTVRLLLLVFGVVVAAQWVGLPPEAATPETFWFGGLAAVLGVIVFTIGVALHNSAPRDTFAWLLIVVTAAWMGETAGQQFVGGYLSGLAGGFVMIVAARAIEMRAPGSPPLIVSFTPAFWILVPGTIGLEGLTDLAQDDPINGVKELLLMLLTMVSIALGVLAGLVFSGSERSRDPARSVDL